MIAAEMHWLVLAMTAGATVAIALTLRYGARRQQIIRVALGGLLALSELAWYGHRLTHEGFRFPEILPLQLCDLTLWLTVAAALTLNPRIYELAYFGGVGGSVMAILMPDLWEPFPAYSTVQYFVSHGFVVALLLGLAAAGVARPRRGSVWATYLFFNCYAALVGVFNLKFATNYMYLCAKPASGSLLDYFGPWPSYILVADLFALGVFAALALPFECQDERGAISP